jgi:hypothetical protein
MLKLIKKGLGRECSFLAFSKEKLFNNSANKWEITNCFRAVINKDKVVIPIEKDLKSLVFSDYERLYAILKDKEYAQGSENTI